ncbi:MAG: ABC transporter ATP-binding protein [Desulfobacterales bacterium]
MTHAILARHVSHSYGDLTVLDNVSFSIEKGEFFIIIGPNGSGKTTLLNAIAGIEKHHEGSLDILGRPGSDYPRKKLAKTLALVQQLAPVDFPFTVTEVVLMGRSPHLGVLGLEQKEDMEIAREALVFTGMEHLAGRKLYQLSGGEQQRAFIARAICQQPQIMLLDEPTASLDLAHQVRVMDLMEKLKEEKGVTVVMVSHDLNLAAMYGDRLLLLKAGHIVSQGIPEDVLTFQTLEKGYDCTLVVDKSPLGNLPRVTLVPGKYLTE